MPTSPDVIPKIFKITLINSGKTNSAAAKIKRVTRLFWAFVKLSSSDVIIAFRKSILLSIRTKNGPNIFK